MRTVTPQELEEAIETSEWTAASLALAIDRDKDYIRDFLVGRKKSLKAGDLEKILDKLGRPLTMQEVGLENDLPTMQVLGTIKAGAWIETYMLDQDDQRSIPVGRDQRFPYARQYALAVSGDSMDLEAPDGSFVICVDFPESGLELKAGLIAHIESIEVDKSETTLKQIAIEDGQVCLVPRSSNPVYKAIKLKGNHGFTVEVRGIVLSVYNPRKL